MQGDSVSYVLIFSNILRGKVERLTKTKQNKTKADEL